MTVQAARVLSSVEGDGNNASTSPVRVAAGGSFADTGGRPGSFVGTYTLERFVREFGQLAAAGILAGRLYDSSGAELGVTSRRVTVAVSAVATPVAVDVEIGPLDANLSGLITKVGAIGLHMAPHSERGNLDGILLSGISDALERAFAGKRLVALLNALLTMLYLPGQAAAPPRSR